MLIYRRFKFLLLVFVFFCFVSYTYKGNGAYDDIGSDDILKYLLKKTIKKNKNKYGILHQYDFSVFSFSVPLIYRVESVANVLSAIQCLAHLRNHDEHLKSFFRGDVNGEYGSIFNNEQKYMFLEKYKNLSYSNSNSSCITLLYSWYLQIKQSKVFVLYGVIYEYSKHTYDFRYSVFNKEAITFKKMQATCDWYLEPDSFIKYVDSIIRTKYPRISVGNTKGNILPNTNSRYDNILEKYITKYCKNKDRIADIENFTELYYYLDKYSQKELADDLKKECLDYTSRDNWDERSKSVSFSVNDIGLHIGVSYIQNKIDPAFGFYFSFSFAAGLQYITCVSGLEYNNKRYCNNAFAFLRDRSFCKNLCSFFLKLKLEVGYSLLRFFISLKSLDLNKILKDVNNRDFKISEDENGEAVIFKLEEYKEACYDGSSMNPFSVSFKEGREEGWWSRFFPNKIIQFGFTLNL